MPLTDRLSSRYNTASDCLGVGLRIGGWEVDGYEYGRDHNVSRTEMC